MPSQTFTLSWIDHDHLYERQLDVDALLEALPQLEAPASVLNASGEVCGSVHLKKHSPELAWAWELKLSPAVLPFLEN